MLVIMAAVVIAWLLVSIIGILLLRGVLCRLALLLRQPSTPLEVGVRQQPVVCPKCYMKDVVQTYTVLVQDQPSAATLHQCTSCKIYWE